MSDVRLSRSQIQSEILGPQGIVYVDLVKRLNRFVTAAKRDCPVGEAGRLKGSIRWEILVGPGGVPYGRAGSDLSYARYVHDGTGIYGPRRRPIVPVRAKVLRFKPRGSGQYVYARSVRGVRPRRFLTDNLGEVVR